MDASPSADELFSQLRASMGSGSSDGGGGGGVRRLGVVAGGVAAVALVVVGVSWLRPVETAGGPASVAEVPEPVDAPTTVAEPAARVWPDDPVEIDGTEVRVGGNRWSVGEPGDLVAVGDWDCDGTTTPAVLRPSVGRLFVFDAWAEAAEALPGPETPADVVRVEPDGCGRAKVTRASGELVTIETTR